MLTIEKAKKNTTVKIKEIKGGLVLRQKLHGMGIREGDNIFILQDAKNGPIILIKDHIKIALGKGMAKKIIILENSHE